MYIINIRYISCIGGNASYFRADLSGSANSVFSVDEIPDEKGYEISTSSLTKPANLTMDQATCSTSSGCPFDIITDDVLILIFSFLTLYERLMVMRVNKRCNRILSNPQTWTHIDFWQEQKTEKSWGVAVPGDSLKRMFCADDKSWMFPVEEKSVLDFLKRYTSVSLKSIYLHIASKTILEYLQQTYSNLKTISLLSANDPPKEAFDDLNAHDVFDLSRTRLRDHDDIFSAALTQSIRVCEIPFYVVDCNTILCSGETLEKFVIRLGKCKDLRRLTVTGMNAQYLRPEGWDALSQEITDLNFLSIMVARRRRRPQTDLFSSQLCAMLVSLLKLTKVSSFRLSVDNPHSASTFFNIDEFLQGIADKWQDLRRLTLVGIRPPSGDIFPLMISALTQLQILELYGEMITDENIEHIAIHLKKLTSLTLTDGHYTPSGIRVLRWHPSIERLYLAQKSQNHQIPGWLLAVYDVILSLPQIAYVKIIGYRVIALHAQHEIPTLANNVQIEVENAREYRVSPTMRKGSVGLRD
ncbi:uncharacterized protein [Amphiura filiformis]|uniref:uncharacterized protein n=1 Tax=Amphiura filiformis TaxID=82378 RepID=UPI003B21798B